MKLYLNKKLESIYVLKVIDDLLKSLNEDELSDYLVGTGSLDTIKKIIDPVQDFIDYYEVDNNIVIPAERKQYIKNSLYSAKGAPEVFKVFEQLFEVKIEYEYRFPVIEILNIKTLRLTDAILFVNKFKTLIYHLLYYTELNLYIRNFILNLRGELTNELNISVVGFTIVKTDWDGRIF